jgi:hypothetical protein
VNVSALPLPSRRTTADDAGTGPRNVIAVQSEVVVADTWMTVAGRQDRRFGNNDNRVDQLAS